MKKPRKPKLLRFPKKPNLKASMDTFKRYEAKCKAVEAENKKRLDAYNKAVKSFESEKKQKESILGRYK